MNKYRILHCLLILVFLFPFIGCKEKPRTAFDDYGDALIDTYKRGQQTADIANLDALKKAIDMYRVENGNYPASLEDIRDLIKYDVDLSKFDYDPDTGVVSLR